MLDQPVRPDGSATGPGPVPDEGWNTRLILTLVAMALASALFGETTLMPQMALPNILAHFHTTQGAWVLTAFMLVGTVVAPLFGKLADIYGKRRMLLIAVSLATIGAVISALAPSYGVFLTGRALQGMLAPVTFLTYSLIRDVFPARKIPFAVGISMAGMSMISIGSPFLNGWMIDTWGFRSIFWSIVILGAIVTAAIALMVQESPIRIASRVDLLGAVLLGAGLAGALIGISFGPSWGWTSARVLTSLIVGVVLIAGWIVSAYRVRDPLVDFTVFRRRPILFTLMLTGLTGGAVGTYNSLLPIMLMAPMALGLGYGMGMDASGIAPILASFGAAQVVGAILLGKLAERANVRILAGVGAVVGVVGAVIVAVSHTDQSSVYLGTILIGLGAGFGPAAYANIVIRTVPQEHQGSISSVVNVASTFGASLIPVIAFAILDSQIALSVKGVTFYTESGMVTGFVVCAVCCAIAALIAFFAPWKMKAAVEDVEQGARHSAEATVAPAPSAEVVG